jgi:hypothetical protein
VRDLASTYTYGSIYISDDLTPSPSAQGSGSSRGVCGGHVSQPAIKRRMSVCPCILIGQSSAWPLVPQIGLPDITLFVFAAFFPSSESNHSFDDNPVKTDLVCTLNCLITLFRPPPPPIRPGDHRNGRPSQSRTSRCPYRAFGRHLRV